MLRGMGSTWETSAAASRFCYEPKTALKNKILKKKVLIERGQTQKVTYDMMPSVRAIQTRSTHSTGHRWTAAVGRGEGEAGGPCSGGGRFLWPEMGMLGNYTGRGGRCTALGVS